MPRQHGITTNTPNRLVLDSGAMYINFDEGGQALIGATRGGGVFTIEQDIREIELDGAMGPIKGLRRIIRSVPMLTFTLMEFTLARLKDTLPASASTAAGSFDVITRITATIADSFYLTNVALVGEVAGQTNPVVCKVKNALLTQATALTTTDKDEGSLPVEAVGHYLTSALDTEPWEIKWPQN